MSVVTPESVKAAYQFLSKTAFAGVKLPPASKVTFKAARMKKFHGLYCWPDHMMIINSYTPNIDEMLKIVAHEMIHCAYEQNGECDHHAHDANFDELADIVCDIMGWKGGVK